MGTEQGGSKPIDGFNEPLQPVADSRLQRISYYLGRRIKPETPSQLVKASLMIKEVMERGLTPPIDHSSMLDYIEGMTSQPTPVQTEGQIYRSIWQTNVYEEAKSLVVNNGFETLTLADTLEQRCGFTPFQMSRWINGITKAQFGGMAKVIEESGMSLRYSWTEAELLHEISLATGVKAETLDEITAARFDADSVGKKYRKDASLEGDFRLLRVTSTFPNVNGGHYLEVHIKPDRERGEGAMQYTLSFLQFAKTFDEALKDYRYTIDYCSGNGASQEVLQYTNP